MESSTKILRRLLDERGVEYMKVDFLDGEHITSFDVNGREYGYREFPDGGTLLRVWHPTPEQAIAAALGDDVCHIVPMDCFGNPPYNMSGLNGNSTAWGCSECGAPWSTVGLFRGNRFHHNFKACPICGRKVVDQ